MKNLSIALIAIFTLLLSAGSTPQANDPGVLLRAAIEKEEVDGDLNAAIVQYKQIIANNGNNRGIAAKALLRLGGCYEKLGQVEARNTYLRLVNDYPDQSSEVAAAKQRLAGLAAGSSRQASRPTFRKITVPAKISEGAQVSPDGAKLVFVSGLQGGLASGSGGDVWTVDLHGKVSSEIAGEPVRLTQGADASWAGLAWSRNGRWIAFSEGKIPTQGIYILPASGGVPRKVPRSFPLLGGNVGNWALGLSSDGSSVAYTTKFEDRPVLEIATVATGENVIRLGDPDANQPAFSPDDKRIAYVKSWNVKPYETRSEVRVARLADRNDVRVTEVPARARSPVWSPDGKFLAFLAQPGKDSASQEVWVVPVSESGEATSTPTKIGLPTATYNSLAGWTADNKIGLLFPSPRHQALYTVPLTGGKATQISPQGFPFHPRWSPDGERIYFRWDFGDIALVPAGGGKISVVSQGGDKVVETVPGGGNHISPDGQRIVFSGYKEGLPGVHLWTMPVSGGRPVRLPMPPGYGAWCPRWSPDGRWIAFRAETSVPGERKVDLNIYVVSAEGGEPRQLTHHTQCFCQLLAWSPDGATIAYTCSDGVIRTIPVTQGEARTVIRAGSLGRHDGLAWTPDGARLVYSAKGKLWTIPPTGGEPVEITTGLDGRIGDLAVSPNGQRIAFMAGSGGEPEIWLMEDFLPLVKAGK